MSCTSAEHLKFKFRVQSCEDCGQDVGQCTNCIFGRNLSTGIESSPTGSPTTLIMAGGEREMCLDTSPAPVHDSFPAPTPAVDAAEHGISKKLLRREFINFRPCFATYLMRVRF